jgi:hypothetical protein
MAIPVDNIQKGRIPLVVSTTGTPLRTIANCKEWVEAYEKARRAKKNRKRAGGLVHTVISSDSESSSPLHHSPDPPAPFSSHGKAKHQGAKKGKPSRYIEVPDPSGSESESAHPEPSTSSRNKDKHHKHHYSSKKRPRSQGMSDSESDSPDTARQARKRTKESRDKKRKRHHKKSKMAKCHQNGKGMMHVYILIQSKYTCCQFAEEMDKSGTAKFFIYLIT